MIHVYVDVHCVQKTHLSAEPGWSLFYGERHVAG